jgi:electron transport complex protein RnfD
MNKINKLIVEPTPHFRSDNSTVKIMFSVIVALLPVAVASVVIFGARAAFLIVTCVCSCVFFEFGYCALFKKKHTVKDLTAVITGILLAFNLPVGMPFHMAVIGAFFSIVVAKMLFGGLGQNFANPAIVGRIVLMLSFPKYMGDYTARILDADVITTATPLSLEEGEKLPSALELFCGTHSGSIGETCALAILTGFAILLFLRIVRPITPLVFIGTVAFGTWLAGGNPLYAILSGGLLLGAIFMATDYATNPMTPLGKIIFGFGCGLITVIIRQFGGMPEGVAFSILTMNVLTPLIDKATRPVPFGIKREAKEKKSKGSESK